MKGVIAFLLVAGTGVGTFWLWLRSRAKVPRDLVQERQASHLPPPLPRSPLRSLWVLIPLSLAGSVPPTAVAQGPARITGVFGDLHYVEQAGDVIGTEIIVSRTKSGYQVVFQQAEGEPGPVDTLPATVKGDSLFFELPPDSTRTVDAEDRPHFTARRRMFRGQVFAKPLRGRLTGYYNELDLPRRARSARRH